MSDIETIRNQIGTYVNSMLAAGKVSPTEMRYILKAIIGEVAEMELVQLYSKQPESKHNAQEGADADD